MISDLKLQGNLLVVFVETANRQTTEVGRTRNGWSPSTTITQRGSRDRL